MVVKCAGNSKIIWKIKVAEGSMSMVYGSWLNPWPVEFVRETQGKFCTLQELFYDPYL